MYSQYLLLVLCVALPLPTIQGTKVMEFKVINEAKGTSPTNYMLGSSQITERYARVAMHGVYDLIRKEIYNKEDPFSKKGIKEITLKIMKRRTGTKFDASEDGITVGEDYFKTADSIQTLKTDFKRKIYMAMTLVFLKADDSKIPEYLQNGLADFIVLEGHLAPDNWAKPGEGDTWSQSSDVIAQFLHYCTIASHGFVANLVNDYMLYVENLDKDMKVWWAKYKTSYKKA